MFRHKTDVWLLFITLAASCPVVFSGLILSQGERLFRNECFGCVVSNGMGFNSFSTDCSCYYICVLNTKLSSPLSITGPWESHKRCCACGEHFSKSMLTCVSYTDKRSDCYGFSRDNPCGREQVGSSVIRSNPEDASFGSFLCSGFHLCTRVGIEVIPVPSCCPDGTCFDRFSGDTNNVCTSAACNNDYCGTLRPFERDDCTCEVTSAPTSECIFIAIPDDETSFMGRGTMHTYKCSPGTCWSQDVCQCIPMNNTGNNDCVEFAKLDFTNNAESATDGMGSTIWTVFDGNVTVSGDTASFNGGFVNIGGLANTDYGNLFVYHHKFTFRGDIGTFPNDFQCMVGNCLSSLGRPSLDDESFAIFVLKTDNSSGDLILILLKYQKTFLVSSVDSTDFVALVLTGQFQLDVTYDLWLIYCGDKPEEKVIAGVIDGQGEVIATDSMDVVGSQRLVSGQSGILLGECANAGDRYMGDLANVQIWRNCKPFDDPNFVQAYDLITAALDV